MRDLDRELYKLKQDVLHKQQLQAQLHSLIIQKTQLEQKIVHLAQCMEKEQLDVDKLEQGGLSRWKYILLNNFDEILEQEKQEAYEAALKHEVAQKELLSVAKELVRVGNELDQLQNCEQRYDTMFAEKLNRVKRENPSYGAEIMRMEALIGEQKNNIRELEECLLAGEKALQAATNVLLELDNAENLGMIDVVFSGGLLFTLLKHNRLDKAQHHLETLQSCLRNLKTELVDVNITADLQLQLDGLTHFADVFFDGLIMDAMVVNQISKRKDKLVEVKRRIYAVMTELEARKGETTLLLNELVAARNKLVTQY